MECQQFLLICISHQNQNGNLVEMLQQQQQQQQQEKEENAPFPQRVSQLINNSINQII